MCPHQLAMKCGILLFRRIGNWMHFLSKSLGTNRHSLCIVQRATLSKKIAIWQSYKILFFPATLWRPSLIRNLPSEEPCLAFLLLILPRGIHSLWQANQTLQYAFDNIICLYPLLYWSYALIKPHDVLLQRSKCPLFGNLDFLFKFWDHSWQLC